MTSMSLGKYGFNWSILNYCFFKLWNLNWIPTQKRLILSRTIRKFVHYLLFWLEIDKIRQPYVASPLYFSAATGHFKIFQFLYNLGQNFEAYQSLIYASEYGHLEIVEFLLKNGVETNNNTWGPESPLYFAVKNKQYEVANLLLAYGAEVKVTKWNSPALIALAVSNKDFEMVKLLISYKADPNAKNSGGGTPLFLAIYNGDLGIIEFLLKNGAMVNPSGQAPLAVAVWERNLACVELLLKYGASVDAKYKFRKDNEALSLIDLVLKYKWSYPIVKLLLQHGADPHVTDTNGNYLHKIVRRKKTPQTRKMAQLFINYGVDINCLDDKESTPLHVAAEYGHAKICQILIDKGADVNARNWNATPLLIACANREAAVVKVLLKKGADVNAKTKKSKRTSLEIIEGALDLYFSDSKPKSFDYKIRKMLLAAGATK